MDRIVVIGGGGHAKVVISVLKKSGYEVVGYTDEKARGEILGVPYLGEDAVLPELLRSLGERRAAIGLGKVDTSPVRLLLMERILKLGFVFPAIISPQAVVNDEVEFGAGTFVGDGAVVNSGAVVGSACILNTNCTVDHDCRLGDNVHVAPGATISGGVTVGSDCMIGVGANIIQGVTICADCLIGAGATVVRSVAVAGTYVGVPAQRRP